MGSRPLPLPQGMCGQMNNLLLHFAVSKLRAKLSCLSWPCLSVSGRPPVLLLPGEEPPSHVPFVERHIQQVCWVTSKRAVSQLVLSAELVDVNFFSCSPHFDDEERLRVLVMMSAQELANGISYSGHMYAMTRAGRHLTPVGDLQETFGGMEQVLWRLLAGSVLSRGGM